MRSRLVLYSLAGALVFAGCLDRKKSVGTDAAESGGDVAPSGSEVSAAVPTLDGAAPDAISADLASDPSSRETTDVPLPGTGGAGGAAVDGANGAGGVPGSGGSSGVTGGAPGSGGVVGAGGIVATGGVVGSGGITGTVGTGGAVGTGGTTTCQPRARDCTSSLDNNCNGTPDNQETSYCACVVGNSQACQEHPGYDGKGICKAGSQTCAASADKTTSSWGACSGSVGPSTRNCTSSADNDCNGTADNLETAYCQCPAATTQSCLPPSMCTAGNQTCTASSDKTTTSWGPCTGYTSPSVMYRDSDGDGYGDPLNSNQVCPGTSGYVSNNDDCDDGNSSFRPGISICGTVTQKKTCAAGGDGVASTETCDQGCINGNCRTDGTIGLPGYVSCTTSHTPRCLAGDGCKLDDGSCGTAGSPFPVYCDGPNDCPSGTQCWFYSARGVAEAKCYPSQPDSFYRQVCDPLATTCDCLPFSDGILYYCQ